MAGNRILSSKGRAVVGLVMLAAVSALSVASAQDTTTTDPNEGNPCSIGWYRAHGWLMWLAFGIFLPLGVLISRYGQYYIPQWFWTHVALQVIGVILATISVSIAINKFQVTVWDSTHVKLGLAIMILVWLQALFSVTRPKRGTVIRPVWFVNHWLFGTAAIILAWFNIFKGLDLYVQDWPTGGERKASYVLWGINVAILAFLYLFLERLPHIRSQSKNPGAVNANMRNHVALGEYDQPYNMKESNMEGPARSEVV